MSNQKPKRILWLSSDHMRYDCISAYGNGGIHTPNLDDLANHGVNFHQCYCQAPVCMPSRASFMTGLYPQQTGVTNNGYCLSPDFRPFASYSFKAAGYQTAHIGKLHVQPHDNYDFDPRPHHAYGFDSFWLAEARGCYEDAWMTWLRGRYPEHVDKLRVPRVLDRTDDEKLGRVIDAPVETTHSSWVSHVGKNFIQTHRQTNLFMHLGFHNPHPPLNPTSAAFAPYQSAAIPLPHFGYEEWKDKPEPLHDMLKSRETWTHTDLVEYRRYFYALVTELDLAIGSLMRYLKQENLLDDTLIVFMADHGDLCGDHSMTHKGASYYDEIMHTPLIFHWPAGLGQDRRDMCGLVENVDILPTLLEIAGGSIPAPVVGRSYAQAIMAGLQPDFRSDVFAYEEPGSAMLRTERFKYIRYNSTGGEVLYDLDLPEHEVVNVVNRTEYRDALHEMRERMLCRALQAGRSNQERLFDY
ncbi:MAG: sulfatase-like hydrolase/transferase [Bacillota bacterium]|nr:sulfatase-like hydrolase/transferase [Bacillota bacterium]